MNQKLQNILEIIQQSEKLDAEQKDNLVKAVKDADKELEITTFKLERTEKVKKTTAILLEETIEELEQKRKAVEEQNRELEIEASLERVRSAVLEMKKQDDLMDVVKALLKELNQLGFTGIRNAQIDILDEEKKTYLNYLHSDYGVSGITENSYDNSPFHKKFIDDVKSAPDALFFMEIRGKELDEWRELRKKTVSLDDPMLEKISALYFYSYSIGSGAVGVSTFEPIDNSKLEIIKKFRNVFFLSYRRFRDIVLAEKQAREAQIEAALEKVRSRSLAMYNSEELQDVVNTVFERLKALEIDMNVASIFIFKEGSKDWEQWVASSDTNYSTHFYIPYTDNIIFRNLEDAKQSGKDFYSVRYSLEEKNKWFSYAFTNTEYSRIPDNRKKFLLESEFYQVSFALSKHIGLQLAKYSGDDFSEKDNEILKRFSRVFEQAYIRFLDLQKAEAQAREAQIEAALERVRSRTMGMQRSDELQDAAIVLFQQVEALGVPAFASGFNIWDNDRKAATAWMGGKDRNQPPFKTSSSEDIFLRIYEAAERGESLFVEEQEGQALKAHYVYMNSIPVFKEIADKMAKAGQSFPTFQIMHCAYFSQGYLMFISYEPVSYAYGIFKRFAKVFEQTYTRFLDLQKAEAQAREVVKQASLDRVRGKIASMRTSEDLNQITPIIWNELKTLEVPFIRCGVFIVDESKEKVQIYLTAPDGKALGVLNLSFEANELTSNIVDNWRKKQVYKGHWSKEDFINWTKSMMELGQVQNAETYQGSSSPPESLHLHFVPFAQGMLYVGDVSPLIDEKLDLVKTLAEAFSIAYARYEDFKNLEEAKNKIEITLNELKNTQAQLVHSEKMASLGELTAGIAHEIKNPLNFVNNFSEISGELLDEIKEELEKNDKEEVLAILEDLKQNLEKINQHGKRADSIVKGMLLHSRGSSGEKTLTDINDLLDQYVNLAYHGMRAQNKEFNIAIEKDYDETLEKINVVPQDISRVFLNIINNACYAAFDRKKKSSENNFSPALKVSTKNLNGKVEIRIGDNGNGIPENILNKIFQPFFTTKPTGEGTGLGLSLSYDIITKVHGGELKVETKEGEGTEFIIQLAAE